MNWSFMSFKTKRGGRQTIYLVQGTDPKFIEVMGWCCQSCGYPGLKDINLVPSPVKIDKKELQHPMRVTNGWRATLVEASYKRLSMK